ncbi:MAG: OmpA family protein, partial [Bacteroidota bacterium]
FGLLLNSCVSKQQFLAYQTQQATQQDSLVQVVDLLILQKDTLRQALSYERGANAALLTTQDKLQDRLDVLQLEIDRLTSNASSTQQDLNAQVREREAAIAELEQRLTNIRQILQRQTDRLTALEKDLRAELPEAAEANSTFRQRSGQLYLHLQEDALFRKNSTSRLGAEGEALLDSIAEVFLRYPELEVHVVGHTDNRPVPRDGLDNWQYAALRAVRVTSYLIDEANVSTNRILAASKGAFAPLMGNETEEGRAENRRITLVFYPAAANVDRALRKELEQ